MNGVARQLAATQSGDADQAYSVVVDSLTLYYPLLIRRRQNARVRFQCLLHDLFRSSAEPSRNDFFPVLTDVSFRLKPGEVVGLVGPNGAGKSTLLRVLAGVERPDKGRVQLNGRTSSLLNLGVGMRPQLTGRENIHLNAMLLGLPRTRVKEFIDEIIELCDIGEFIDAPLGTYSSGMKARLGFSVATHAQPDILLLDEVIGAGDAVFRARSGNIIQYSQQLGRTVIVATHSEGFIRNNCGTAIFLDKGRLRAFGPAEDIIAEYRNQTRNILRLRGIIDFSAAELDAECAIEQVSDVGDKGVEPQAAAEHAARVDGVRLGLCIADDVTEGNFTDYFMQLKDEAACPGFELVTVFPHVLARADLRDQVDALLVADVPELDAAGVAGLSSFTRSGGVLVVGPRALRRTVGSEPGDVSAANANMVDYAFTPLGEFDAARLWGNFRYSNFRLTVPTPLYPGADAAAEYGGAPDGSPVTGALAMPTEGALSIAEAGLIDATGGAEVGRADVLLARRNGGGVVFRLAVDCRPGIALLDGLFRKLTDAEHLRTIVSSELSSFARQSRLAHGPAVPTHHHVPGSLTVRLEPVVVDARRDPLLMSRDELANTLERIAGLGATAVHLVVKLGSALINGLGIETYPSVDPSRDILRESAELARAFGLEVVPTVSCFDEHYPGQRFRPTDFMRDHPDAIHLTRRQVAHGLTGVCDCINAGEQILSSPHMPVVKKRICGVVTALAKATEFSRIHLNYFHYNNDAGGFSPAELATKHGLELNDPETDHKHVAEAELGRLAREIYALKGDTALSVEAYHPYSIGFPSDYCISGVFTSKVMPPNLLSTYVRRHASAIQAFRSVDTWVYPLDVKTKSAADIIDIVNVVREAGCHRFVINGFEELTELRKPEWDALRGFLRQSFEPRSQ